MRSAHLTLAHAAWSRHVRPFDRVIDATCGNGHDTLVLAKLLKGQGELIAYDIQKQALITTEARLLELTPQECNCVKLKQASHASFSEENVALIVYNLGYLPGGDKTVTTQTETTLSSLHAALRCLNERGMLSITCYPGHEEGARESLAVLQWLTTLDPRQWRIVAHRNEARPTAPHLMLATRTS